MMVGGHLIGKIARYYGLMTNAYLRRVSLDQGIALLNVVKLLSSEEEVGGRHYPNMSFTNRLRAMDDMLGDIDSNIYTLSNKVKDLTVVVSRMSEQYDRFYQEFDRMRLEQDRFHTWKTNHMSQLLSYHHIEHTRYDGTRYSYASNVPNLGIQQGVNFMTSPQIFSTAPTLLMTHLACLVPLVLDLYFPQPQE
nr:hypothetical protein [Tanacetum cinerariifolium]